jgi:hypothetical protein
LQQSGLDFLHAGRTINLRRQKLDTLQAGTRLAHPALGILAFELEGLEKITVDRAAGKRHEFIPLR